MRVFADKVYGIPPEQVIGSSIVTKFEIVGGVPVLTRLPELNFMDDNVGKPVAINMHIGAAHRRVRQLGRRFADAAVDDRGHGFPIWVARKSHRR